MLILEYLPKVSLWSLIAIVTLMIFGLMLASGGVVHGQGSAVVKVYWTDRDNATLSVTDVSLGAISTQVLVSNTGGRLQDVDLDPSTGVLYFADWGPVGDPGSQGSIKQLNKDGTGLATVLNTGDAVHQLALDQTNQIIYFTRAVSYDNHEISHVDYAGSNYTVLLTGGFGGPGWFPSGLALDSGNSLLYWGDIGVILNPPNGSVNRMGANGSAPTQLTPHVNGRGRGYVFDPATQTIFFTSHNVHSPGSGGGIFSYDIANNIETQLISDPGTGYWDIEIDPIGQRIWWTDYGRGQIRSAKFDGSDVQVELSGLSNPYGLALELVTGVEVELDIKPTSCPNPLNVNGKGNLSAALLGTDNLDVNDINVATLQLEGVSPLRSALEDVAASFAGDIQDPPQRDNCTTDGPDGFSDLTLKFDTQAIVAALGAVNDGDVLVLTLTGELLDGTPIQGQDVVWIKQKGK